MPHLIHYDAKNTTADACCGVMASLTGCVNTQPAFSWVIALFTRLLMRKHLANVFLCFIFVLLASNSEAATPPNTAIINTATASYSILGSPVTVAGSAGVSTTECAVPTLQFLQQVPGGAQTTVQSNQYAPSGNLVGPFVAAKPLHQLNGTALTIPGTYTLAPANLFIRGEPIFIKVTAYDQNKNPLVAETIAVTINTSNGDQEVLQLTETGASTGIFIGGIQTSISNATVNDDILSLTPDSKVSATFGDTCGSLVTVSADALFDPYGIVFDSQNGNPVNGATVTIVNAATGAPATVYGDDGVSIYPSTVVSGGTVTDSSGRIYTFPAGKYRFPQLAPGNYRLVVTPPGTYIFASSVPDAQLQALATAPYALQGGSRGQNFTLLPGPPLKIDVPLDPGNVALKINKTAQKTIVGEGEFVPYTITINNAGTVATGGVQINDQLPLGFRLVQNSVKLNGVALTTMNVAPDGRTTTFLIGNMLAGASNTLTYVAEVTVGAKVGIAENIAYSPSHSSNTARATVMVQHDLFRDKAILIGSVMVSECGPHPQKAGIGIGNVRILLEDGTYVLTDAKGLWHIDNVVPGTHVVQLDKNSLPSGYEVLPCYDNTRTAGRSYSEFVNVRGGAMWNVNFVVKAVDNGNTKQKAVDGADKNIASANPEIGKADEQLVEKLPYDAAWLSATESGREWLHPKANFQPALPVVKVAVKHLPKEKVSITVNHESVSALLFEGTVQNASQTVAVSHWNAVPIKEGENSIEVTIVDANGKVVLQETRKISYTTKVSQVALAPEKSTLVADGKTRPVIAVRVLDAGGRPIRRGSAGEFQLSPPYQSATQFDNLQSDPLARPVNGKARFTVGEDGVALIPLMPTTQTGEAVLTFTFNDGRTQELRAWLAPGMRDWVLVGFAEGTLGNKKLSGNMEALKESGDNKLFDQNKLAFYAKGSIKGEYLLTLAYDSAKPNLTKGNLAILNQAIDPQTYYTLYGDATQQGYDASSARKLYLKIERKQFYAMFGDFNTGLTVTELSRYNRTVNGVKSEYKGEKVGYSAFATLTNKSYVKDEIQGDGTSGLYHLSRNNIVMNSDKIRVDTRDRFQSEVIISSQTFTRFLDYDIDYVAGTLFFKQPITSRDVSFNPNFIIAEYESGDSKDEKLAYGGRANIRPIKGLEVGATLIHDGTVGAKGNLQGADATYFVTDKTKIRAEYAHSDQETGGDKNTGHAYLAEVTHQDDKLIGKAYVREQGSGFGLGQQADSETGTRKYGVEGRVKINDTLSVEGQTYRQELLNTSANREDVDAKIVYQDKDINAYLGARHVKDEDATGAVLKSDTALAGVSYRAMSNKLTLHAATELQLAEAGSIDYPNRIIVGADYAVTDKTKLFVEDEWAQGQNIKSNMTRIGLRTVPWTGAEVSSSINNATGADGSRVAANLGLVQRWKINEQWQADAGIDSSHTVIGANAQAFNPNVPLASGGLNVSNATTFNATDFIAASAGLGYRNEFWSANGRVEYRHSDVDDKFNFLVAAARKLENGQNMAAGLMYTETSTNATVAKDAHMDLRLSYALRPLTSDWSVLDRLDLMYTNQEASTVVAKTSKIVNNLNVNYHPNTRTQVAMQYGAKYVLDSIDGTDYTGYTDLMGLEARYDISTNWDIGVQASLLNSWRSKVHLYSYGLSLGYRLMENTWVAVGYNEAGINDSDFIGAEYRAKGPYISVRIKFDQDTLGLNDKKSLP